MLSKQIKNFFDLSVSAKYEGVSNEHPIILLNSIKNIIGDDKENPSKALLNYAEKTVNQYNLRDDDKIILEEVAKDGIGSSIFISDLEDACQTGIPEAIEKEAARLQWVSDNGLGGLEVLVEVALQDFNRLGIFCFHLLRANNFNRNVNNTWPYTRCLVKEIIKKPLPDPHEKADISMNIYRSTDKLEISQLTSAHRLWYGDYVRGDGYKREISHWYKDIKPINVSNDKYITKELKNYILKGGSFFIDVAEELIGNDSNLIFLESLRYLIKNDQSFSEYVSSQISSITNSNE